MIGKRREKKSGGVELFGDDSEMVKRLEGSRKWNEMIDEMIKKEREEWILNFKELSSFDNLIVIKLSN